jgi:hypothetical protein
MVIDEVELLNFVYRETATIYADYIIQLRNIKNMDFINRTGHVNLRNGHVNVVDALRK